MNTLEQNAQTLFNQYIFSEISDVVDLTKAREEDEAISHLKLTHFHDHDTLLYSRLIERALNYSPEVKTIIDLGAGSSIPSLLAVKNSNRLDVKVIAVDIDDEAHSVGSSNAQALGLQENFIFYKAFMNEALAEFGPYGAETLIVSNPPYIASPDHLNDKYFVPVNGGVLGDDFLLNILKYPYKKGVTLALLWSSLTSPKEIVPIMKSKFEFIYTEAYREQFGEYTKTEPLRSHLYRMRDKGEIYFESENPDGEIQYIFGSILRAR